MATGMRDYVAPLTGGVWKRFDVEGDYFQIVEAADALELRFSDGTIIKRRAPCGLPVGMYTKVEVLSTGDQTVRLAFGYAGDNGVPYDGSAVFAGTVNVLANLPTIRETPVDVEVAAGATVQVLPADATRVAGIVQLPENAAGSIRVGGAATDGTHGTILYPGDAAVADGSPAVHVHNPNGSAITVTLQVERAP